eukprot:m.250318 g.250318  ORF g.250318 m.250318 type:complete len:63 (-) comp17175_c1_seq4:40-228(-)
MSGRPGATSPPLPGHLHHQADALALLLVHLDHYAASSLRSSLAFDYYLNCRPLVVLKVSNVC